MVIGVISDTHGLLRTQAVNALHGSDFIIHAGDIGGPDILKQLEKMAPVTAVRGNVDMEDWARKIPLSDVVVVDGVWIYVLHILNKLDLKPEGAGIAAVVYGHSHIPKQEFKNQVLYFNPDSAGPRRFDRPVSVGRLLVEDGNIHPELIHLDV
jgi:hypothetical protein